MIAVTGFKRPAVAILRPVHFAGCAVVASPDMQQLHDLSARGLVLSLRYHYLGKTRAFLPRFRFLIDWPHTQSLSTELIASNRSGT